MNFIQQSYKGKTDWWRWMLITGLFLTPYLKMFLTVNLITPLMRLFPQFESKSFISNILVYVFLFPLFVLLFDFLHKRSFITLITNRKKIDWLRFWLSFASWGVFSVLMFSLPLFLSPNGYNFDLNLISFLVLLIACVVIVPFQVFFFTIFLRSYLLQFFSFFVKTPLRALIIVVMLFVFLMYNNTMKSSSEINFLLLMHHTILGFLLGLIILLDEGVEIVLGMTLASSFVSVLLLNYTVSSANSYTMFLKREGLDGYLICTACFVSYPMYFYFLLKTYNWKNWKQKLFSKVEKPVL